MPLSSVIDNDVLIKMARYRLLTSGAFSSITGDAAPGVLSAARFVAEKRIARNAPVERRDDALAEFREFFRRVEILEPSDRELLLALSLEDAAQALGLALDAGESQLVAIVTVRRLERMLSGDKRALIALERLVGTVSELQGSLGVAVCLEQVMACLVAELGVDECRESVCADPSADRALSISFSCGLQTAPLDGVLAGLRSYIAALRQQCPRVLSDQVAAELSEEDGVRLDDVGDQAD